MFPYYDAQRPVVASHSIADGNARKAAGLSSESMAAIRAARGDPNDIRRFTQALIDHGQLSSNTALPLAERVRQMMFDHGVGVDCAGYVQHAYLYASGTSRAAAGFTVPGNEDLSLLPRRGFTRVPNVPSLKPGDIVSLGPPSGESVGHRVIVYDQHEATPSEVAAFLNKNDENGGDFLFDRQVEGSLRKTYYVVTVDSSWGSAGNPQRGGVDRRTWWYNAICGTWAWKVPNDPRPGTVDHGSQPYGHPIIGFFRGPASGQTRAP
jgi:hypothetical protein